MTSTYSRVDLETTIEYHSIRTYHRWCSDGTWRDAVGCEACDSQMTRNCEVFNLATQLLSLLPAGDEMCGAVKCEDTTHVHDVTHGTLGYDQPREALYWADGPGNLQKRIIAWITASFGERAEKGTDAALVQVFGQALVTVEEVGEMVRCLVKAQQGIRQDTDWVAELKNEMGDVGITLLALAEQSGIDFWDATRSRFDHVVSKRANGEH
jgi:NTP pyrophosphatase (non-canonical NTP hydrolase)